MALPTVIGTLAVSPPAFLRKLRRKNDWGGPDDGLDTRSELAANKVFQGEESDGFSVYLIRTDEDLRRVAIGLNSTRDSATEEINLVAFHPEELTHAGISSKPTPGNTRCHYANRLHHDLTATRAQLVQLCHNAMQGGRAAKKCTSATMRDVLAAAQTEQCDAAFNPPKGCLAENCNHSDASTATR